MTSKERLRARAIGALTEILLGNHLVAEACLEALGAAGFHVIGPDITDDMARANGELPHNTTFSKRFLAMVAAGDLTKGL
jgi:hypothetical protein